jgi:putative AdoMet-dependent methyltransferase
LRDSKGFDIWADEYDKFVEQNPSGYPFEGYYDVLNYVYELITIKKSTKILDMGFGTGQITNRLYKDGANIYGIDFSEKMIEIAREKMPQAKFIQWDFSLALPAEFEIEKFDYIISSYAIHHLKDNQKVELFKKLKNVLNKDGKIIIADIAFKTKEGLLQCQSKSGDIWDSDETYIIADEFIKKLKEQEIIANYKQISSCAGILEIS